MCIMAGPVKSVTDTRIFVGADGNKTRQCVIYAMAVELQGKVNAMILPVPLGTGAPKGIELVDLSNYPTIFDDLNEPFVERSRGLDSFGGASKGLTLEVHKVGSYSVSIVPDVESVKRLGAEFVLSPDTEHTLRECYPVGFAFVVARLRESGPFHPLAYTHPLIAQRLFVPTRHEHGGRHGELPEWDHLIFHQSPHDLDDLPRGDRQIPRTRRDSLPPTVPSRLVSTGRIDPATMRRRDTYSPLVAYFHGRTLARIEARGHLSNIDLTLEA